MRKQQINTTGDRMGSFKKKLFIIVVYCFRIIIVGRRGGQIVSYHTRNRSYETSLLPGICRFCFNARPEPDVRYPLWCVVRRDVGMIVFLQILSTFSPVACVDRNQFRSYHDCVVFLILARERIYISRP